MQSATRSEEKEVQKLPWQRYPLLILGGVLIVLGVASVIVCSRLPISNSGEGLWSGIVVAVTGTVAVFTGFRCTKWPSIFCTFLCLASFGVTIATLMIIVGYSRKELLEIKAKQERCNIQFGLSAPCRHLQDTIDMYSALTGLTASQFVVCLILTGIALHLSIALVRSSENIAT